jgi:hypothetical protein
MAWYGAQSHFANNAMRKFPRRIGNFAHADLEPPSECRYQFGGLKQVAYHVVVRAHLVLIAEEWTVADHSETVVAYQMIRDTPLPRN